MYFRIRTSLGINTTPYYSGVVTVNVTCYSIDMSIGFVLDKIRKTQGLNFIHQIAMANIMDLQVPGHGSIGSFSKAMRQFG